MRLFGISLAFLSMVSFTAFADNVQVNIVPYDCNMTTGNAANASGTYSTDTSLFAAVPSGTIRKGMFVQCLTASCMFALNFAGDAASLTAAGNMVINGQYGYYNAVSMGWVPQSAVRIIASGSSVISAWACPK